MDKTDRDDFEAALGRLGYSSNDFQITETDLTQYDPNRFVPLNEEVSVRHISTSIERTYYSRYDSNWVVDFENDLSNGVFN